MKACKTNHTLNYEPSATDIGFPAIDLKDYTRSRGNYTWFCDHLFQDCIVSGISFYSGKINISADTYDCVFEGHP